ncbi:hypothetical protein [Streptomyces sp. ECR3]|uniref:hypothetical protein n=1 Tax=Streptomyces sp. ECR3 TaxID=3400630 RepID=UPI003F1AAB39
MNPDIQGLYRHLTDPLTERGLHCTVEYGLSDWIARAELPDGSYLVISPPQEPTTQHPPGHPDSWFVTHNRDNPPMQQVIYNSHPDGLDAAHRGSASRLLHALDDYLDDLGIPPRRDSVARATSPTATRHKTPDTAPTAPSAPPGRDHHRHH